MRFRVVANDDPIPAGMALIPAGNFQMGNALSASGDGNFDELPGSFRVLRGGGWGYDAIDGRTAYRDFYFFRIPLAAPEPHAEE